MTPGLALFVKTPAHSPVKSRLWPSIGREAAEALYLDCAEAVAEVARRAQAQGALQAYWAVAEPMTEDEALGSPWQGFPCLAQGAGGLGERMATVHAALCARHGAGLLVGVDLPQIDPTALIDAAARLVRDEADLVLGPTEDGGFWLVGARGPIPRSAWMAPRYSTAQARADFLDALPAGLRVHELAWARDLDEGADLGAVAAALAALPAKNDAQQRTMQRLHGLLATLAR